MYRYAHINEENIVVGIYFLNSTINRSDYVLTNVATIGQIYSNNDKTFKNNPTIVQNSTKITKLAFLNRFTDDEAVNIDLASTGITRESALLRRYLQKVNAAAYIDLSRQDLSEDLQKLVTFNLLTEQRKNDILTNPIQENEIFGGV